MNKQIVIGLTGGIGSGKSYAATVLRELGVPILDTDNAAKKVMTSDYEVKQQLIAVLGEEAYLPTGELNKTHIASFLFQNEKNATIINGIVHPAVYRAFLEWKKEFIDVPIIGMETAILFESGFDKFVDVSVGITASEETRIQRVMKRDGVSAEQVKERLRRQLSEDNLTAKVDYIITNDEGKSLRSKLKTLLTTLYERFSLEKFVQ